MGILDGKRILVTGVLTDASIAFHVARVAQEQGATVVLTAFPRPTLVERIAKRLPAPAAGARARRHRTWPSWSRCADRLREHVDGLDGVVHSIGNAPQSALGGNFLATPWEDVATAVHVSTFSLKSLAIAVAAADARRRFRRRASTSTPASPGRATTGWASPRPASSPALATWPATSARSGSG